MYKPDIKGIFFHVCVIIISVSLSLGLNEFLDILASETGRTKLLAIKGFLDKYPYLTESIFTIFFIITIEYVAYYIKIHKLGIAALNIGLFYCSTRHNEKVKRQSDDFLRNEAIRNDSIAIICANGYRTFAVKNSPLHEAFRNASRLRVILLNPLSSAVDQRAQQVGFDPDKYKRDLVKSLCFLKDLQKKRPGQNIVQVKFYKKMPFWKFIILEQSCYIWVQQSPENKFVYDSPCYAFAKLERREMESMYAYFLRQFNIKWNSDKLGVFDFNNRVIRYSDGRVESLQDFFEEYC